MRPELRQAIIKANPDYFSWDKAHQEKYGQAIPKEAVSNNQKSSIQNII